MTDPAPVSNRPSGRMNGGRALAEMLRLAEVGPMFGMGGFQLLPFYDALAQLGMRHFLINDERCGAFAADAYARVTNRPGVCDGTLGPGATNLVTGLIESLNAGVPIIALAGDTNRAHSWKNMTQECRQTEILRPAVKELIRVEMTSRVPELLRRAFAVATSGRPVERGRRDEPAGEIRPVEGLGQLDAGAVGHDEPKPGPDQLDEGPKARLKAFGVHYLATPAGGAIATVLAGLIADALGWHWAFYILTIPTLFAILVALRLPEPERGRFEVLETPTAPPFVETARRLWAVRSLRYQWIGLAFTNGSVLATGILVPFFLRHEFHMRPGPRQRSGGPARSVAGFRSDQALRSATVSSASISPNGATSPTA